MKKESLKWTVPAKPLMLAAILALGLGSASCSNSKAPQAEETTEQDNSMEEEEEVIEPEEKETELPPAPRTGSQEEKPEVVIPGMNTDAESVTTFLKAFYAHYVFDAESMEKIANDVCTPKLLKYLEKEYDYDCMEEPCYAMWCFRTSMQDGPSDVSKVTEVIAENDGWFKVSYLDMGNKGVSRIRFIMTHGKYKMDEVVRVE